MKIEAQGHWYDPKTGEPKHFVEKKDGSGLRPTTLRDAMANNWVPSVTTILKILHREALVQWLIRQAVLTVLTAPRPSTEPLDAFVDRVLSQERQQDQEAKAARDLGTDIHDALEQTLSGGQCSPEILPWIAPCRDAIASRGKILHIEKILVGDGYAGKTDLVLQQDGVITVFDFKTTKSKLPAKSYAEHCYQTAAYAKALDNPNNLRIQTGNAYISTSNMGEFSVSVQEDWEQSWKAFEHLVAFWQIANNYNPTKV